MSNFGSSSIHNVFNESNTALSISSAKYLGNSDRIILAGNLSNTNASIQLYGNEYLNGVDGKKIFRQSCGVNLEGVNISSMTICGIPRLMKSFAIAGGNFTSDGSSALYFVDIKANSFSEPALNISNLSADSVPGKALTSPYRLTALTARPDDELLAASNEGGEIIFYDLNAGKTVHQVRADATGVNQIVFNPAGQLLSIGNSSQSPAKLWDLRLRPTEKSCLNLSAEPIFQCDPSSRNDPEPSSSTSGSSRKNAMFSRSTSFKTSQYNLNSITCVATHPSQSAAFFGSYLGSVYYWDLRINKFIEYKAHSSIVNDVIVHPTDSNTLISSSNDGTVKLYDYLNQDTVLSRSSSFHRSFQDLTAAATVGDEQFKVLYSNSFALDRLDTDAETNSVLISSKLGSIWNFRL